MIAINLWLSIYASSPFSAGEISVDKVDGRLSATGLEAPKDGLEGPGDEGTLV